MKRLCILLCAIAVLAACATSQDAPTFVQAPVPPPTRDAAILYVYRINEPPLAWDAFLEIDGEEAVSLSNQGFSWVTLKPGTHKFQFGWPMMAGMPRVRFERSFEAGRVYAFQMRGDMQRMGDMLKTTSAIVPIGIEKAKGTMAACCRYVPPKRAAF